MHLLPRQRWRTSRIGSAALIGIAIFYLLESRCEAGSIVEEELATVTRVQVHIASGALLYQPPPGFDQQNFQATVVADAREALLACGVAESDAAPLHLWFTFDKASRSSSDPVAIQVGVELREPAEVVRNLSTPQPSHGQLVTTWSAWQVSLVDREEEVERLEEISKTLARRFAQAVGQARAYSVNHQEGQVNSKCFKPNEE